MPIKPGSLVKATPGSVVAIIDDQGAIVPPGTIGHITCRRPHPVMFREYLNRPDATREKFTREGHRRLAHHGRPWPHGR
jgi:acetyl-CoA synthetase